MYFYFVLSCSSLRNTSFTFYSLQKMFGFDYVMFDYNNAVPYYKIKHLKLNPLAGLDKLSEGKTNFVMIAIIVAVALLLVTILGLFLWKRKGGFSKRKKYSSGNNRINFSPAVALVYLV